MHGKCSVCGKEGEVFVCCSACGAMSLAYCGECLTSGAEPWDDLVAYIALAGHYPDKINKGYREIVRHTCRRLGRTEKEFAAAVDAEIERMDAAYSRMAKVGCQSFRSDYVSSLF